MSSRLERRFQETKSAQQADPFLLSGLDPSLMHELRDLETIRSVVDSVIRTQWMQIHPDRAPSPAEKQRREQAKGQLESALQQLKSAEFEGCLQRFRRSFPELVLEGSADMVTSFSRQFESLDSLLLHKQHFLPLSSLRDVTIELFDLPTLAKELNRLCKESSQKRAKALLLELLHLTPETMTLTSLDLLQLGHQEIFLNESEFGRELHKRIFTLIQDSQNEDLKLLRLAFKGTAATDAELAIYEEHAERWFANVKEQISSIWNSTVESLATSKAFDEFLADHADCLKRLVVEQEIAEIQTFAQSLPMKRLYIDPSGRFSVDGETGSLHSAPLIENRMIKPESLLGRSLDEDDDDDGVATVPGAQQSVVDLLIRAALKGRESCPMSHATYRPESAVITSSKDYSITARERNAPAFDSGKIKNQTSQVADLSFSLPGTGLEPQQFFYDAELGFPPAVSASLMTQEPQGQVTDAAKLYLLVSHRSQATGTSVFYLEGFVHRIFKGQVTSAESM